MTLNLSLFFYHFIVTSFLLAQDCSHLWQHDLKTDPIGPKGYMGDTNAAYGVFPFKNDRPRMFKLTGHFMNVRFFSIETYTGKKNHGFDKLFDYEIAPHSKDQNDRNFTVVVVPENLKTGRENELGISENEKWGSIWLRYYLPDPGIQIQESDLPQIEAFDPITLESISCPKAYQEPLYTKIPDFVTYLFPKKRGEFEFKVFDVPWAANGALPGYSYGYSRMRHDEVALFKFLSPTVGEEGDVRYWSLCSVHFIKNMGLSCLADSFAIPDPHGFVTVVLGSEEVKSTALQRGQNFLPDLRKKGEEAMMVTLRNILPSPTFRDQFIFRGEYNPRGILCRMEDYLSGLCEL